MDIPPPPVVPPSSFKYPSTAGVAVSQGKSILTEEELARFKNLLVFAKSQVEGYFAGKHQSRYFGSSAEFCDYREYVPGENIDWVDWRCYARTRRLFVRRYHEETDMVVYLLVDTSGSMSYAGAGRKPKFQFASKIAAALSYLMIQQGDKVAAAFFSNRVNRYVPASGTRRHLYRLVSELELIEPCAETGMARAVTDCDSIFKKRGILVILSDFLDDCEAVFEALGRFMKRNFEILLLQLLDPDELNLPAINSARFVDLESGKQLMVEPEEIRRSYQMQMDKFVRSLGQEAAHRQIRYQLVNTNGSYLDAIEFYLGFRYMRRGR